MFFSAVFACLNETAAKILGCIVFIMLFKSVGLMIKEAYVLQLHYQFLYKILAKYKKARKEETQIGNN